MVFVTREGDLPTYLEIILTNSYLGKGEELFQGITKEKESTSYCPYTQTNYYMSFLQEEIGRYIEEGMIESNGSGGYQLTKFAEDILKDGFELFYEV